MPPPALPLFLAALLLAGCQPSPADEPTSLPPRPSGETVADARTEQALSTNLDRILAYGDSIEAALRPVPLLTPAQARTFDRYRNEDHLVVARRLGVPQPVSDAARERLIGEGRLVPLEDSRFWTVRELDHSTALVTPDTRALLEEIGDRFQTRLADLGLPPLRLEVTSILRTSSDQERLRQVNPNATRGVSTHQFGTTIDVAYSSFRPPLGPVVDLDTTGAAWMEAPLRRVEDVAIEAAAARMSRELMAQLATVLREMQAEGKVMVTMEVRQPVFHMTVARAY